MKTIKKLLRFLHITKPIKLSRFETKWIMLCKGCYADKYKTDASSWIETLKPMFKEIYGWKAEDQYDDFLDCMFNKLSDIYMKIQHDMSGHNVHLKEIIGEAFYKSVSRNYERPIERCIAELCGHIQCNLVIKDCVPRYHLEPKSINKKKV